MEPWRVAEEINMEYSIRAVSCKSIWHMLGDESRSLKAESPYGIGNAGKEAMAKLAPRRKRCTPGECTSRSWPAAEKVNQLRTAAL